VDFSREALERAVISVQYSGYVAKQEREIAKFLKMESEAIPEDFDFTILTGLKREAKDKFTHFRPGSLGQASRIEGVTPGDISVLSIHLLRHKRTSK
jgi:tRNA uridine 5-carboxymethylaminomethyl modification enzyme